MSDITFIADGNAFNSRLASMQPLGGAEKACIGFANSLAACGHRVQVYTTASEDYCEHGVHWQPLDTLSPQTTDIVMAHRSPRLFSRFPIRADRKILYVHNPTDYLSKWKHRKHLYRHRPEVIFSGHYHASTWPKLLPKTKQHIIPYAVDDLFLQQTARPAPPPRAIFTSNPLRSLDWLLNVWSDYIHPQCPHAELHLYCGPTVYPNLKADKKAKMQAILAQAQTMRQQGVIIHEPLAKQGLIEALKQARVMLYRGDLGESFCLALAEAQALGVPAVTAGIGACSERVQHEQTGFIAKKPEAFAKAALRLLQDDTLWLKQHQSALTEQTRYRWADAGPLLL